MTLHTCTSLSLCSSVSVSVYLSLFICLCVCLFLSLAFPISLSVLLHLSFLSVLIFVVAYCRISEIAEKTTHLILIYWSLHSTLLSHSLPPSLPPSLFLPPPPPHPIPPHTHTHRANKHLIYGWLQNVKTSVFLLSFLFLSHLFIHWSLWIPMFVCAYCRISEIAEWAIHLMIQMLVSLTLKVLVTTIDTQWEGMGDVGSARYKPALLPPCLTIWVLSYSN